MASYSSRFISSDVEGSIKTIGYPLWLFPVNYRPNINIFKAVAMATPWPDWLRREMEIEVEKHVKQKPEIAKLQIDYKMSDDEVMAISYYTFNTTRPGYPHIYKMLNEALITRELDSVIKPWIPFLYFFQNGLRKLPNETTRVFRAINKKVSANYKQGNILVWVAFNSTSTEVRKEFAGEEGTVMVIDVEEGKNISAFSCFPEEKEVLLLSNIYIKVEPMSEPFEMDLKPGIDILFLKQEPTPPDVKSFLMEEHSISIEQLVNGLRDAKKVKKHPTIKNNNARMCFSGSDAVAWLKNEPGQSEESAQKLCRQWLSFNMIKALNDSSVFCVDEQYCVVAIVEMYNDVLDFFNSKLNVEIKEMSSFGAKLRNIRSEDIAEIVDKIKTLANLGDPFIQVILGFMYKFGCGVSKDDALAVEYFQRSADADHPQGQNSLGLMYQHGHHVKQDYKKAVDLYKKSANSKCPAAQCNLGKAYQEGHGYPVNNKKAVELYQLAADQDDAEAQHRLGSMFYYGYGVKQDYKQAFYYYQKSAGQQYCYAQFSLGLMYEEGKGVNKDKEAAIKYYEFALWQKHPLAKQKMGRS